MSEIEFVICPKCYKQFYVETKLIATKGAYCYCPFCHKTFKP